MKLLEDNQTTATNIKSGRFPKLRHVQRMHGVDIRWPYDAVQRGVFTVCDCHTQRMAADIFTKHFTSKESWEHAIRLLGFRHGDFSKILNVHASAAMVSMSGITTPDTNPPMCSLIPKPISNYLPIRDVRIPPHAVQSYFP